MKIHYFLLLAFLSISELAFNQDNTKRYIQLGDSVKIEYQELSIQNAIHLIDEHKGEHNIKYSIQNVRKAYTLIDDRILIVYDSLAILYNSDNDLALLIESPFSESRNILNGLNPYNQDFPAKTTLLINQLADFLKIRFDGKLGIESLIKADSAIIQLIDSETFTRDQIELYTLHSIALAGEVYMKNYGGHWKMIKDDDGTWQPYIESRGNNIDLFVWVFDSFTNRDSFYPSVHSGYLAKTNTLFKE